MTKSLSFKRSSTISCEWIETIRCFISTAHQIFFRLRLHRSDKIRTYWNWMGHNSLCCKLKRVIYWAKI